MTPPPPDVPWWGWIAFAGWWLFWALIMGGSFRRLK
jgi:hypothetical protein